MLKAARDPDAEGGHHRNGNASWIRNPDLRRTEHSDVGKLIAGWRVIAALPYRQQAVGQRSSLLRQRTIHV